MVQCAIVQVMLNNKHYYNIAIGRTRSVRGPDTLELVAVCAFILAILVIPMAYGHHQIRMAEMTEPVSLVNASPNYDLIIDRSLYGRWPSAMPEKFLKENGMGAYTRSLKLGAHGSMTAGVIFLDQWIRADINWSGSNKPSGFLSFRPVIAGAQGYGSVLFLCGYASPPPGVPGSLAENRTTLADNDLPPECRKGRQ